MKRLKEKAFLITRRIPRGRVATYGAVARSVGNARAARAVGNALNKSPGMLRGLPAGRQVPCHRVVRADGSVGGFAGGSKKKIRLLEKEGVKVRNGKIDLKKFGFNL